MKAMVIMAVYVTVLSSCSGNRQVLSGSSKVHVVDYEPMYKRDRKLEEYSKLRTNAHGSAWPGNGGSYASSSYRQSAIEAKEDQLSDPVKSTYENRGKDNLSADTADAGRAW